MKKRIAFIDQFNLVYDGRTLNYKGLGGSESALIYMAKELTNLGHTIHVYNNCQYSGFYDGVEYINHKDYRYNSDKPYDIVISLRSVYPFFSNNQYVQMATSAKKKIVWMHDTFCAGDEYLENMLIEGYIDEVFTLSDFHSWYFTTANHGHRRNFEVLKHKFFQTRNGAKKYDVDETKIKNQFVFNAAVNKGLKTLIEKIWPKILDIMPEANLIVIGGYYNLPEPDEQQKLVMDIQNSQPKNVTFTGIIPQNEVAKIVAASSAFLYPTEFPETFGISTLESLLYGTPLITNVFGALEETAIDLGCYKIPYSSTNNILFQNVDEEHQAEAFLTQFKRFIDNPYEWRQKSEYCKVVEDIAEWDTIALQWDQHFATMFSEYYPVDKYRKVKRINEKVARIFGRRFNNIETRNEYSSFGKQRRIIVISPFRNTHQFIENHIASVAAQDYENYIHVIIDDASDTEIPIEIKDKLLFFRKESRQGAIRNQIEIIENMNIDDDDIVMLLDGDDFLIPNNTLFHFYNDLYNQGYDFTYGSSWSLADNIPLVAQDWSQEKYDRGEYPWKIPYTHLRTMSGFISKEIAKNKKAFIREDGNWMMAGADNPMFRMGIKLSKNPKAVKEITCIYNDAHALNDFRCNSKEQTENAVANVNLKGDTMKKILIAVPMARDIEPETMKSIYDLKIPEGVKPDFQYFHGYRIDQIRNLIADWCINHYDYVFFVDSDIVLPNDALVKLYSADKPVIGGVYRQRRENMVLEVYNENGNILNYDLIKDKGVHDVIALGFGATLVRKDVFEAVSYPQFEYHVALDHANTISEDWDFCQKVRNSGYTVSVHPDVVCGHIGRKEYQL